MQLSVATYNVHRCLGRDGRRSPERISRVLEELACDVVALQEVDSAGGEGTEADQLDYLARRGDYHAVAGPTLTRSDADYGNALLARVELAGVLRHSLPSSGEPRGAIEASIEHDGVSLRVLATHLGLGLRERRLQAKRLLEIANREPRGCTVLLGDFNEWLPQAARRLRLESRFGRPPAPATFPSFFPCLSLDRVFVHPAEALQRIEAVRTPTSRVASDHLPLRATVDVPRDDSA